MPGSGPKNYPCTLCKKRTKPDERRPVNKDTRKILRKCFMIDCADGVLCRKCRHKCGNLKPTSSCTEKSCVPPCATPIQSPVGKSTVVSMKSPPSVTLPLQSTANTHAYCVLCRRPGPKLVVVPAQTRFTFFLEQNILISSGTNYFFSFKRIKLKRELAFKYLYMYILVHSCLSWYIYIHVYTVVFYD